ncbi:unnamed protein product [Nesidiocoris tenuis]|uniref:Uncharacterized protein n=1 Tax=Nesidiocoris tenuis TaxID=355587 RepID=A0A6H5G9M9_9HEMI|nr:unnamed protein product [Nesidiocoris tenuis]
MKMARASCSINRGNSSTYLKCLRSLRMDAMVSFGQLADFHGPVGPAREEPRVRVQVDLGDALADTFEETGAGVFSGEIVQQLVQREAPDLETEFCSSRVRFWGSFCQKYDSNLSKIYLDIPISGSCSEKFLSRISSQTLDGGFVGRKSMTQSSQAYVHDANVAFLTG